MFLVTVQMQHIEAVLGRAPYGQLPALSDTKGNNDILPDLTPSL